MDEEEIEAWEVLHANPACASEVLACPSTLSHQDVVDRLYVLLQSIVLDLDRAIGEQRELLDWVVEKAKGPGVRIWLPKVVPLEDELGVVEVVEVEDDGDEEEEDDSEEE